MIEFQFTEGWFNIASRPVWDQLIPQISPTKILEVGSFEGASACYLIQKLAQQKAIELHCIDTWGGGVEHDRVNMNAVEARFASNTQLAIQNVQHPTTLVVHKGPSDTELCKLICDGKQGYFDFIYIDGSHQAPDVLSDLVLAFKLLRVGGVMAMDDYVWKENLPQGTDPIRCPKIAIDSFTNICCRKLSIITAPLPQMYIQKTSN